jgi:hypothetical protein
MVENDASSNSLKRTHGFTSMTPSSSTRVGVESAIQEWSGGAIKVSVGEGGGIEVAPVSEMSKDGVENVGWNEASIWEGHTVTSSEGSRRGVKNVPLPEMPEGVIIGVIQVLIGLSILS